MFKRGWLLRLRRHPCVSWFAWLALIKGIPAMVGLHSVISTPEARYANWTLILWGIQFTAGGTLLALGLLRDVPVYRCAGFRVLAIGALYDIIAILYYYGLQQPAYTALYGGFAVACAIGGFDPVNGEASRACVNGRVR